MLHAGVSNRIVDRVMTKPRSTITMSVQRVEEASAGTYRLIVDTSKAHKAITDVDLSATINERFKGKVRYLSGSAAATGKPGLVTLFVKGNIPVMTKEVASTKGMVEIAANVFKDADDCVWTLSEDAAGNAIFTSSEDSDYGNLLNAARSAHIVTASLEVATAETYVPGNIVSFYDVASENRRTGIAVTGHEVFVPEVDAIVPVHPNMVLAATDDAMRVSLSGIGTKTAIVDYMRSLYGKNSVLFKKMKSLIDKHLSL